MQNYLSEAKQCILQHEYKLAGKDKYHIQLRIVFHSLCMLREDQWTLELMAVVKTRERRVCHPC